MQIDSVYNKDTLSFIQITSNLCKMEENVVYKYKNGIYHGGMLSPMLFKN